MAPENLYEAMYGDSPAAKTLFRHMHNNTISNGGIESVSGLSQIERWQSLQGSVIVDPKPHELVKLRAPTTLAAVMSSSSSPTSSSSSSSSSSSGGGGVKNNTNELEIGILDIVHRKGGRCTSASGKQLQQWRDDELWIFGTTRKAHSVAIRVDGFEPTMLVIPEQEQDVPVDVDSGEYGHLDDSISKSKSKTRRMKMPTQTEWSVSKIAQFQMMINRQMMVERGKTDAHDPEKVPDVKVPRVVTQIVGERLTPRLGFCVDDESLRGEKFPPEQRRDVALRIYVDKIANFARVAKVLREQGYRVSQDNWPLSHQLIHRTFKERPYANRYDEADYTSSIRTGRWVGLALSQIGTALVNRSTTCQLEIYTPWTNIRRRQNQESIPFLTMAFDIECYNYDGYQRKINRFPTATNKRDEVVCISNLFTVNGHSQDGPFLRVAFVLMPPNAAAAFDKEPTTTTTTMKKNGIIVAGVAPVPNTITYVFRREKAMHLAWRHFATINNDIDSLSGYNSQMFDIPYILKRMVLVYGDESYLSGWGRFIGDTPYVPWAPSVVARRNRSDADAARDTKSATSEKGRKKSKGGGGESPFPIVGRWQMDLRNVVMKMYSTLDDNTLRAVCGRYLKSGVSKVDLDVTLIGGMFNDGDGYDVSKIIFYCIVDSIVVCMLDLEQSMSIFCLEIASEVNASVQEVVRGGEQVRVFGALIQDMHLYCWYDNPWALAELVGWSRPVPYDWNNWSAHNHLHQYLARERDAGNITPDLGFIESDPRPARLRRDAFWKKHLRRNFAIQKMPRSTTQEPLSIDFMDAAAAQIDECDPEFLSFCNTVMYSGAGATGMEGTDLLKKRKRMQLDQKNKSQRSIVDMMMMVKSSPSSALGLQQQMDEETAAAEEEEEETAAAAKAPMSAEKDQEEAVVGVGLAKVLAAIDLDVGTDEDDDDDDDDAAAADNAEEARARARDADSGKKMQDWVRTMGNPKHCDRNTHLPFDHPDRGRRWWPGDTTCAFERTDAGMVFPCLRADYADELIGLLDFASLYPSAMMGDDIDYSTEVMQSMYGNVPGVTYRDICHRAQFYRQAVANPGKLSAAEHIRRISAGQPTPKPMFRTLLPRILERMVRNRRAVRAQSVVAEKEGRSFDAAILEVKQLLLKLLCNATYGFTNAAPHLSLMPLKQLAFRTCSTGRDSARIVKNIAESDRHDAICVYGDTDSVMLAFPNLQWEKVPGDEEASFRNRVVAFTKAADRIIEECAEIFLTPHDLENESLMRSALFLTKKMYTAYLPLEKKEAKRTMIKGLECKKRCYPNGIRALLKSVQSALLLQKPFEAERLVRDWSMNLAMGRISYRDLSRTIGFNEATQHRTLLEPFTLKKTARRLGCTYGRGDRLAMIRRKPAFPSEKPFQLGEEVGFAEATGIQPDIIGYFDGMVPAVRKLLMFTTDTNAFFRQLRRDVCDAYSRRQKQGLIGLFSTAAAAAAEKRAVVSAETKTTTTMMEI